MLLSLPVSEGIRWKTVRRGEKFARQTQDFVNKEDDIFRRKYFPLN